MSTLYYRNDRIIVKQITFTYWQDFFELPLTNKFLMLSHLELSDEEFENQFENCSLSPEIFNHEAHLRLAWIHVKKYGCKQAVRNVSNQLITFTNSLGATNKFNMTLTVAAVNAVYHFFKQSNAENFPRFIAEFPRLKFNFKELMAAHYKVDIFNSETARKKFVEPDLLPFL